MDTEEILKETLTEILNKIGTDFTKITVEETDKDNFSINIESENPSLLIGYHGENIQALQHLLKVLVFKKTQNEKYNILVDIDNYRKRREENTIGFAERKIDFLRKTGRPQTLPPMSPYFRRKVHLHCMNPGFEDVETESRGTGEDRHILLKLKQ